jgi:Domain of Unknown Function (DUF928)
MLEVKFNNPLHKCSLVKFFMLKTNKPLFRYQLLGLASVIILLSISIWSTPGTAKVTFRPPGDRAPKTSSGAASRGNSTCGFSEQTNKATVTPLLPPATNIGLTMAERPTIFVYIAPTNAKKAFFSIQDEDSNHVYQQEVNLPQKPGVMEVKLPTEAPELKTGKNYKWSLVMICTAYLEPDSPSVSGWVRRVESRHIINNLVTLESASMLAQTGIWYDTLSTLAQMRRNQPNNQAVSASWQELLESVGLDGIANEPLIN